MWDQEQSPKDQEARDQHLRDSQLRGPLSGDQASSESRDEEVSDQDLRCSGSRDPTPGYQSSNSQDSRYQESGDQESKKQVLVSDSHLNKLQKFKESSKSWKPDKDIIDKWSRNLETF